MLNGYTVSDANRYVTQRESGTVLVSRYSNISDMAKKQSAPTLTKAFVGYGHYRLTVAFPEGEKSAISGDMDLIERLNSEVEKEREEAIKEAIAFVQTSA